MGERRFRPTLTLPADYLARQEIFRRLQEEESAQSSILAKQQRTRRLESTRDRNREARLNENPEERASRLTSTRDRNREARLNENQEEREARLASLRDRDREARLNEAPEEREARLASLRDRDREARLNEDPEEREARLASLRDRDREARLNEDPEEREARLASLRDRDREARLNEDPEEREARLASLRDSNREARLNEDPEERASRLASVRDRTREARLNEDPEEREARLASLRDRTREARLNEDPEEREARLAADREYQRARSEEQRREREALVLTNEEMEEIRSRGIGGISAEVIEMVKLEAWNQIKEIQTEKVCSVCDELVLPKDSREHDYTGRLKEMMDMKLIGDIDLPTSLREQYDMGGILSGLLLARKGVTYEDDDEIKLRICCRCYDSLMERNLGPPKFSIANSFAVGEYPIEIDISSYSKAELMMCARTQTTGIISLMKGGNNRAIRSHITAFGIQTPAVTLLPRRLDQDTYMVILQGSFSPAQRERINQRLRIDRAKVERLIQFRIANNHLYSGIRLTTDDVIDSPTVVVDDPPATGDSGNTHHDGELGVSDEREDELAVLEETTFLIQRTNMALPTNSPYFWEELFPELFPYGRGMLWHFFFFFFFF